MQTIMEDAVWQRGSGAWQVPRSLLDQIGWKGLLAVGWCSTPLLLRPIALPYTLLVYRKLLAASDCPWRLLTLHTRRYQASRLFRMLRPRFRKTHAILRSLQANSERATAHLEPLQQRPAAARLQFA